MKLRPGGLLDRRYFFLFPVLLLVALLSGIVSNNLLDKGSDGHSASAAPDRGEVSQTSGFEQDVPADGCTIWRMASSPYSGSSSDHLYSTAVITSTDAWAVGDSDSSALTLHWDGTAWSAISSSISGTLQSVAALATNDVWAVGYSVAGTVTNTLTMHWDGTTWSAVTSPNPGAGGSYLYGVAALATNDVWAVGYSVAGTVTNTLTMHWDGTTWSAVTSPNAGAGNNNLRSIAAASAGDIWAVGSYMAGGADQTLVEHWDGAEWSIMTSPNIGTESNDLTGVAAVSATDVWAVGYYLSGGSPRTLTIHWDGTSWGLIYSPNTSALSALYGVVAVSSNEVWAVGYFASGATARHNTLSLRWNGSQWGRVSTLNVALRSNNLYGVAATGPSDIWAVGANDTGGGTQSLVQRYSAGPCNTPTPTLTGTPPTATSTATPPCGLTWRSVPSNFTAGDGRMYAVSVISATQIWAVGTGNGHTAALRWNGTAWSSTNSPSVGVFSNVLYGMSVVSPAQIWAVGSSSDGSLEQTLIARWNGIYWGLIPSPNVGSGSNVLYAVARLSSTDVWAVGSSQSSQQTLIEHWDGTAWTVVPSPNAGTGSNYLRGMVALSANDVWAVGAFDNGGSAQNLIEHWDGISWSVAPVPNSGDGDNRLNGIAAISPTDIWAVGTGSGSALTMHWDGTAWSLVDSTVLDNSSLNGVGWLSSTDVWAVGIETNTNTLALHWDGAAWSRVPSTNPNANFNTLNAVAPVVSFTSPGPDVWAVGSSNTTGQTLLERYFDLCLAPTSTPTSTSTPTFTPTSTGTPTNTPTATRTATPSSGCDGGPFVDVCPSDYFNTALMYLMSHGVISGYYDNTFRPYSSTIRGQLCKIMVLAEGWTLNCPTVHFSDVPTSTVFFCYVETAYAHGIISGYTDGTFHPITNITRAQLCKIIVQARQWPIDAHGGPHFTDVPTDYGLYAFIETAYNHGIIGGYQDGTFHPTSEANRGQISKIVYLAITQP